MTGTVSERTRTSFSKEASVASIVIDARPYRLVAPDLSEPTGLARHSSDALVRAHAAG
jgi:hypothetical protein